EAQAEGQVGVRHAADVVLHELEQALGVVVVGVGHRLAGAEVGAGDQAVGGEVGPSAGPGERRGSALGAVVQRRGGAVVGEGAQVDRIGGGDHFDVRRAADANGVAGGGQDQFDLDDL